MIMGIKGSLVCKSPDLFVNALPKNRTINYFVQISLPITWLLVINKVKTMTKGAAMLKRKKEKNKSSSKTASEPSLPQVSYNNSDNIKTRKKGVDLSIFIDRLLLLVHTILLCLRTHLILLLELSVASILTMRGFNGLSFYNAV